MAVAKQLGYAPDLLASGLASDRSNLVALMVDDFSNPHKLVLLERLSRTLREQGLGTLLVNMLDDADAPTALLSASQRRVDACVMIGTRFNDKVIDTALGARRIRKLIVFARRSQHPDTITIACDDEAAMQEIAGYLKQKCYQRPLFVAGPDTQSATLNRKTTFCNHWKRITGDTPPAIHVDEYNSTIACEQISATLTSGAFNPLPDVLVCENDILAMGAMDALRYRLGLSVPQEVAVTGFDDIPLSTSPAYDLTTFRQPISLMTKALIQVIEGDTLDDIKLPGTFIQRGSA